MLELMTELLMFESVMLELSIWLLLTVELITLLFIDASMTLNVVKCDTLNEIAGVVVLTVHSELGHALMLPLSRLSTTTVGVTNSSPSNRIIAVWFIIGNRLVLTITLSFLSSSAWSSAIDNVALMLAVKLIELMVRFKNTLPAGMVVSLMVMLFVSATLISDPLLTGMFLTITSRESVVSRLVPEWFTVLWNTMVLFIRFSHMPMLKLEI